MKLFNNYIKTLCFTAVVATITSCSGGTCAPNGNSGNLSLAINAPAQYPAGVAVTAYLTMTNTSNVNGNNLVYTIPTDSNHTGVIITPYPKGAGEDCTNIPAGKSCTFTAYIPAGSKPGSFTVLATPNGTMQSSANTTNSAKNLQADSISVTANLGLVDVPNTQNEYYILPNSQVLSGSTSQSTIAYISVWVKQVTSELNSFNLVDETGNKLLYTKLGTENFGVNSVNSYAVTIPAGKSLQHVQVLSNVCSTLNVGTNNDSACSNDADISLVYQGNGILNVEPSYFNMNESYTSQVITLTNTGSGTVSSIVYPNWSSLAPQFSISNDTCASLSKLLSGQSCTMTLNYVATSTSSSVTPVFTYDDDNNAGTAPKNTAITVLYQGKTSVPFSTLTQSPVSISLTPENPYRTIILTNTPGGSTVGATITNLTLPTLNAPLELESTNCTNTLSVGDSCTYIVKYIMASTSNQQTISFNYNNGIQSATSNVAVDWVINLPGTLSLSTRNLVFNESNQTQTITLTNTGVGTLYNLSLPTLSFPMNESAASTCADGESLAVSQSCDYIINVDYGTAVAGGNQVLTFSYKKILNAEVLNSESAAASYESQSGIFAAVAGSVNQVDIYSFNKNTGQLVFIESTGLSSAGKGVTFSANGQYLYVTAANNIYSFSLDNITGHLTQIGSATASSGSNNMVISPDGTHGYVANSAYGSGGIMLYNLGADGSITFNSNVVSSLNMPFQLAMSQNGNYLYTGEFFGSPSRLLGYSINPSTGALTQISRIDIGAYAGMYGVSISPNESYLYVTTHSGANAAYIYRVQIASNGTLSNNSQVNYLSTSYYQNMTFSPNGLYAYVGNSLTPYITEFSFNSVNGNISALTPATASVSPSNNRGVQSAVVFDPTGTFAYAGSYNAPSVINQFKWNNVNGQLEALSPNAVTAPDISNITNGIAFSPIP